MIHKFKRPGIIRCRQSQIYIGIGVSKTIRMIIEAEIALVDISVIASQLSTRSCQVHTSSLRAGTMVGREFKKYIVSLIT